jgi:tetratricopeptide (TPR) repeat protein
MDLQAMFNRAVQLAERGEYRQAAEIYESLLEFVEGSPQVVRSIAFNLAQVLNKTGDYQRALELTEMGLSLSPTDVGIAIGQAARGEALCGLKRFEDGKAAFQQAAKAHPIIGRLNSADSMTRVGGEEYLDLAEQWVTKVTGDFGHMLNESLRAEVHTILSQISEKRGDG